MRDTSLGGPYNKDYSILGSILGYPSFGKLPFGTGEKFQFDSPVQELADLARLTYWAIGVRTFYSN